MVVRRRAFPLDVKTRRLVEAGKMIDPRKGVKTQPHGHIPKMRVNVATRPQLFNSSGVINK